MFVKNSVALKLMSPQWFDAFTAAKSGDDKYRQILSRYDRLLELRREKKRWADRIRKEMVSYYSSTMNILT